MIMDAPVVLETSSWDCKPSSSVEDSENGIKGFPFDDSDFNTRDRGGSFNSHLEDLAKRHPELAEHLNFDTKFKEFPFRSNTWGHKRRGSLFGDNKSEPTSFRNSSRFGSPHSAFEKEFTFPFDNNFTESVPSQEPTQPENTSEKPPQVPATKERSRKPNPHVPQSNTVDLGQKQEPVKDTREQRSMSAPPENRAGQQRFVSSVNIPVQGDNDSSAQSQTSQQSKPSSTNERVIPIHVEGRDEPVMPKNPNQTFNTSQQHNQRPGGFGGGTWNRGDGPYYSGEPQFQYEEPHSFYNNSHRNEAFGNAGASKPQKTAQEPTNQPQQQQQQRQPQPSQPPPQQAPPQPQQKAPSPPPTNVKLGPIEQIQRIQKDVLELMNQVEKFNGKPKDKDYVYLDEMLTRNLLKLDDVETEGKEKIRNARKEAIKCIQKCISILEAKANANELLHNISNAPLTSLEISGVSRSGTEASIPQEESVTNDEKQAIDSTETEVKDDSTPMQTNEPESTPLPDNTPVSTMTIEQTEPAKSDTTTPTDVEMTPETNNAPATEVAQNAEIKSEPMEVEQPKEKKDKKKVKKKVEKN